MHLSGVLSRASWSGRGTISVGRRWEVTAEKLRKEQQATAWHRGASAWLQVTQKRGALQDISGKLMKASHDTKRLMFTSLRECKTNLRWCQFLLPIAHQRRTAKVVAQLGKQIEKKKKDHPLLYFWLCNLTEPGKGRSQVQWIKTLELTFYFLN